MTRLLPREEHPHGMSDFAYDGLFTAGKPVVFAYHGYPWLIHRLVMDVIDRVPGLAVRAASVHLTMADARTRHRTWIREHGTDLPEVAEWTWDA